MRAVIIPEWGGPEILETIDTEVPVVGADQIRVGVRAFGVNRAEVLHRRGLYPTSGHTYQSRRRIDAEKDIPGLEFAGEIDAVGDEVEGLTVGDRVMGIVEGGSYAEYVVTAATHAIPIPEDLPFVQAAAIPEVFITAYDALERLHVTAGEWVLVHAVGSGVGTAAVQLVVARGARCIGTSRTPSKLERAAALGMEAGIDTTADEFAPAVHRITEHGANAAIDLVGGPMFASTLDAMASRGRVIVVGLTAGRRADVDLGVVLQKRLCIEGTVLRSRSQEEKTDLTRSFREAVLPLFLEKRLRVVLDRVFSFDEIRDAHAYMESNASFGKIVVEFR